MPSRPLLPLQAFTVRPWTMTTTIMRMAPECKCLSILRGALYRVPVDCPLTWTMWKVVSTRMQTLVIQWAGTITCQSKVRVLHPVLAVACLVTFVETRASRGSVIPRRIVQEVMSHFWHPSISPKTMLIVQDLLLHRLVIHKDSQISKISRRPPLKTAK